MVNYRNYLSFPRDHLMLYQCLNGRPAKTGRHRFRPYRSLPVLRAGLLLLHLVVLLVFSGTAAALGRDIILAPRTPNSQSSRFALVLGNGTYATNNSEDPWNLPKALNDASDMSQALASLGF